MWNNQFLESEAFFFLSPYNLTFVLYLAHAPQSIYTDNMIMISLQCFYHGHLLLSIYSSPLLQIVCGHAFILCQCNCLCELNTVAAITCLLSLYTYLFSYMQVPLDSKCPLALLLHGWSVAWFPPLYVGSSAHVHLPFLSNWSHPIDRIRYVLITFLDLSI